VTRAPLVTPDAEGIARAVAALDAGRAVGMPTETVYGLAADATDPRAVARIYAAKGRPRFNPLIAHVASVDAARIEGQLDERALALAAAFWPGPLTLVVPVAPGGTVCELARAGLDTIGLRVPSHPAALRLLQAVARPLAAPSANPSGRLSPTCAADVAEELGEGVALVLDGGPSNVGIESTIVAALPGEPLRLLRPGAIARAEIEVLVGALSAAHDGAVRAPGQLASHYAPRARLRLDATDVEPGEVLLAFGPDAPAGAANLSESGDPVEAAARLYTLLRQLDATGAGAIAVAPIPDIGLGEAINDRLRRAAAPRD
jgi:L-threonylcarbamoyladenylate synthase